MVKLSKKKQIKKVELHISRSIGGTITRIIEIPEGTSDKDTKSKAELAYLNEYINRDGEIR